MDSNKLRQLVTKPEETSKLDFKIELYKINEPKPTSQSDIQKWAENREQQWAEFIKDIIALANGNIGTTSQTGYLIVGAGDKLDADGKPTLRDVGNVVPTRTDILGKINSYCQPALPNLQCEEIVVDGVKLFVISIPPSPYLYRLSKQLKTPKKEYSPHTAIIRRGDGERTYEASPDEQRAMEQEKQLTYLNFSTQTDANSFQKDLEKIEIQSDQLQSSNYQFESGHEDISLSVGGILSNWRGTDTITINVRNDGFQTVQILKCDLIWRVEDEDIFHHSLERGRQIRWVCVAPWQDGYDNLHFPIRLRPDYILQFEFSLTPKILESSGLDISKYPLSQSPHQLKGDYIVYQAEVDIKYESGSKETKMLIYHYRNHE